MKGWGICLWEIVNERPPLKSFCAADFLTRSFNNKRIAAAQWEAGSAKFHVNSKTRHNGLAEVYFTMVIHSERTVRVAFFLAECPIKAYKCFAAVDGEERSLRIVNSSLASQRGGVSTVYWKSSEDKRTLTIDWNIEQKIWERSGSSGVIDSH